ncbi:hypothetical protein QVD17_08463 [Tagetes erecta]|uniref:Uncharacterized protein n=1 Tax=Tagetes erecta TaxID=13708 RepID=A0AAD8KY07_TARER|nr:hypothetical protein QVD17_08463 [Tagetes erecta]
MLWINVQNVQTASSLQQDQRDMDGSKFGAAGSDVMMKTADVAASSTKGNLNDMVTNLIGSGGIDDTGKRSYADQVLAKGKESSNAGESSIKTSNMFDMLMENDKGGKETTSNNRKEADEEDVEMPFKFSNFLLYKPGFSDMVKAQWLHQIEGVHQFKLVKKLRLLKHPIRSFLHAQGNLHSNVTKWRNRLDEIHRAIDLDPSNGILCEEEARCLVQFNQASIDEERFLKQKAKVHWLAVGDANNSFFHNSLKCKNHSNRIERVIDTNGLLHEGGDVPLAFVKHFEQFLGVEDIVTMPISPDLFERRLENGVAVDMCYLVYIFRACPDYVLVWNSSTLQVLQSL